MPPKKSSTKGTKRSSGLGQPTLSFSQRKPGTEGKSKSKSKKEVIEAVSVPSPEEQEDPIDITLPEQEEGKERKRLNPKSKEWAGVYRDAKVAMGNMEPIHAGPDTHNQVHHVLRVFDCSPRYGPFVGVTRLQRWERAKKWGLNPPEEIYAILTTKEGVEDASYRENVLHTWL